MDKDCGIGHYSLHRVQLSPFKGHITGMSGGRHRLFQGILQVHLPDCLFPAGSGDTVLPPQPSALLTMPEYEKDVIILQIPVRHHRKGLPKRAAPFAFPCLTGMERTKTEETTGKGKWKKKPASRELPGKVGKRFFSDGKVAPCGFGKNHPHFVAVFFPKTLPFRKRLPSGPCSSTGCQSPNIHN